MLCFPQRFDAPGPLAEDKVVNIPRGSGIRDISDVLMREGVIDQSWVFLGGVLALKAREDLKAGEYQFKAHASLRDVVATIVDGRVVAHQLTIPEGLTSEQIVARLLDDDVLTGNALDNRLEGRDGNDTLIGGAGFNSLIGGAGSDQYLIDADGLTVVAARPELLSLRPADAATLITPHAGELARLTSSDPDQIEV